MRSLTLLPFFFSVLFLAGVEGTPQPGPSPSAPPQSKSCPYNDLEQCQQWWDEQSAEEQKVDTHMQSPPKPSRGQ